jgi:nitrite reductase/ring-hydroxylating ferredoxin subunit
MRTIEPALTEERAMPDASKSAIGAAWTRAAELSRLEATGPIAVKIEGRQIALFRQGDTVRACNNRCPHEGYPLVEGALGADCVLTCNWHNWKFDLSTGENLYGGDNLRIYPVRIEGGAVWVDLSDPPVAERVAQSLYHLDAAMADFDSPRIARELARLGKAGAAPEVAVARAIAATHDRLRYGTTHAYAGADAWLRLRDTLDDEAQRLACATEALSHIAFDTLREARYPYAASSLPWDAAAFAAAIEAQDEATAIARIEGALAAGLGFEALEPVLTAAALAHYQDFGHTLIYLVHAGSLSTRLGPASLAPLLRAWVRSAIHATREDLLPDFRGYEAALRNWPRVTGRASAPLEAGAFEGRSIRDTLAATLEAARTHEPAAVYDALFEAAARHLLRFDERHALATTHSASDNVGWLDCSHALTFAHALRAQAARHPGFWPRGLQQLALFVGRNKAYLDPGLSADDALARWSVDDEAAFHAQAAERIVDHGIGLPIFPVHWLKTWTAVRDETALGLTAGARRAGLAAVNRLLAVRFKERHAVRNARQALGFVGRED